MTDPLALRAMQFARTAHAQQVRKYTGNPYADHLAEVAGIVAAVATPRQYGDYAHVMIAVAWLHDYIEDVNPKNGLSVLESAFGPATAYGVLALSDLEPKWDEATQTGHNRAERKAMTCRRLADAPGWVQTIKCADLISNTSSIVMHDPKFAVIYLEEKRALLAVLTRAHPALHRIALEQAS